MVIKLRLQIIELNPTVDSESAPFPIPKITDYHSAPPKILVRNQEPLSLPLEAVFLLGVLSSKSSIGIIENCGKLEVMVSSSFFPQDFSCCLEFVMQICSKSNSRSFFKENVFDEIYFPWSDFIFRSDFQSLTDRNVPI